jgi:hypothetical protein
MTGVEFDLISKNIDEVETVEIPNYWRHHFVWVNCVPFFSRNFFIRREPDKLMVWIQIRP